MLSGRAFEAISDNNWLHTDVSSENNVRWVDCHHQIHHIAFAASSSSNKLCLVFIYSLKSPNDV